MKNKVLFYNKLYEFLIEEKNAKDIQLLLLIIFEIWALFGLKNIIVMLLGYFILHLILRHFYFDFIKFLFRKSIVNSYKHNKIGAEQSEEGDKVP